jgi:hypothetical protein
MQYESPSDGYDRIGFPFRFYTHFEGKAIGNSNGTDISRFNWLPFLFDLVIVSVAAFLLVYVIKKTVK